MTITETATETANAAIMRDAIDRVNKSLAIEYAALALSKGADPNYSYLLELSEDRCLSQWEIIANAVLEMGLDEVANTLGEMLNEHPEYVIDSQIQGVIDAVA